MIDRVWDLIDQVLAFIVNAFNNPDDFRNDPKGHAVNQPLHMVLGAGILWVTGSWLILAIFIVLWEAAQYALRRAKFWDCVADAFYMFSGAVLLVLISDRNPAWIPYLTIVLSVFAFGLWKRIK
ncbi:MAG: hypothetical protein AAF582_00185 [Pseudomonadota bacterium]